MAAYRRRCGSGLRTGCVCTIRGFAVGGRCATGSGTARPVSLSRGVWSAVVGIGLLAWAMPCCMRPRGIPVLLVALAGTDALLTSTLSIPTMLRLGSVREQWRVLDEKHSPSLDLRTVWLLREESACRLLPITDSCLRNDQVITKIPVFNAYVTERNPRHLAMVHHPVLRRAATGAERFWFAPYTARVEPTDRNFVAFVNRAEALRQIPLVIRTHEAKNAGADTLVDALIDRLPAAAPHKVHITAYSPRELAFDVEVATNGWLLVTDRWARSWRLQVNGIAHPIYGGNFIFRAVSLATGKSHVRFTYRPVALPWLVLLSWGTLAIIGVSPLWSPLLIPGSDLQA